MFRLTFYSQIYHVKFWNIPESQMFSSLDYQWSFLDGVSDTLTEILIDILSFLNPIRNILALNV